MRINHIIVAVLYAASLNWWHVMHAHGILIDSGIAALVFIGLYGASVACAFALNLSWRNLIAVFAIIYMIDLSVSAEAYLAYRGAHARDVPLAYRPVISLIFAAVASSGFLLPQAVRLLRRG